MTLTIEVCTPECQNVHFPPIGRNLRGRFDAQSIASRDPDASKLLQQWTKPVPGQQLSLDLKTGEGRLIEPLNLDEYADLKKLFEKRGIAVPNDETFADVHVPSWLWCMQDIVDGNYGEIVDGSLPTKIEGERKRSFITPDHPDEVETLRRTVSENSAVMREAVEAIRSLAKAISDKGWDEE